TPPAPPPGRAAPPPVPPSACRPYRPGKAARWAARRATGTTARRPGERRSWRAAAPHRRGRFRTCPASTSPKPGRRHPDATHIGVDKLPQAAYAAGMDWTDDIDATGLRCPLPVLKAQRRLRGMPPGAMLRLTATDPMA